MKTLKILPIEQIKALKLLKVIGPEWNRFTGFLPYLRDLTVHYNYKQGDDLDAVILESLKKDYPDSYLASNELMLYEGQLDQCLSTIRGGSRKNLEITFMPSIDIESLSDITKIMTKTFTSYAIQLSLRLNMSEQNDKFANIYENMVCYLDTEQIDKLIDTLKSA